MANHLPIAGAFLGLALLLVLLWRREERGLLLGCEQSTCTVSVGNSGSVSCSGASTCHVTCSGSCSLSCDEAASCDLRCADDDAARPISGAAQCP